MARSVNIELKYPAAGDKRCCPLCGRKNYWATVLGTARFVGSVFCVRSAHCPRLGIAISSGKNIRALVLPVGKTVNPLRRRVKKRPSGPRSVNHATPGRTQTNRTSETRSFFARAKQRPTANGRHWTALNGPMPQSRRSRAPKSGRLLRAGFFSFHDGLSTRVSAHSRSASLAQCLNGE